MLDIGSSGGGGGGGGGERRRWVSGDALRAAMKLQNWF